MSPTLPALSPDGARELDRVAEDEFHVPLAIMMENTGRTLAALVRRVATAPRGRVLVLAGKGGNGGAALAGARHLLNRGWEVEVGLAVPPETLVAAAWLQYEMVKTAGASVRDARSEPLGYYRADVVVDGILGFNARGEPRPPIDAILRDANAAPGRRIALDIPTGIDPESGEARGEPFRAEATLLLAMPKKGAISPAGRAHAGRLWVGDTGFPAAAYRRLGAERPEFDEEGLAAYE